MNRIIFYGGARRPGTRLAIARRRAPENGYEGYPTPFRRGLPWEVQVKQLGQASKIMARRTKRADDRVEK